MDTFHIAYLEGLFLQAGPGDYNVSGNNGPESVAKALAPMLGRWVRVLMHHFPPDPKRIPPGEWGSGCCHWQPNPCPAGHHERPNFLFHQESSGVLHYDEERPNPWWVNQDGYPVYLNFSNMRRHYGRLAVHTKLDLSEGPIPDADKLSRVVDLAEKARSLIEVLERLKGDH